MPRALRNAFYLLLGLAPVAPGAQADPLPIGPNDVETVFYINKSDDHNRVDYAIHLDRACHPVPGDEAVYFYWREFEEAPPVRIHGTNFLDRLAYGILDQHALKGSTPEAGYFLRLKRIDRDIVIHTTKAPDGKCTATAFMEIAGVQGARLASAFVKLRGLASVEYVELHGARVDDGALLSERIKR